MSFSRDAATTLASRAAVLMLGLVQSVVVARYLLPEGRGMYGVLMLIPQITLSIAPLGLNWAFTYALRRKPQDREFVTGLALSSVLTLGLVGYLSATAAGWALRHGILQGVPFTWFLIAALAVPLQLGTKYWAAILRGLDRIVLSNKITALRALLVFVCILVALLLFDAGVLGIVVAVVLVDSLVNLASLRILARGIRMRLRANRTALLSMLRFGVQVYGFSILLFLNYRFDTGLLRYFLDFTQVGYYVTAVALAEIIWNVPNSLGFVLFPTIAGSTEEQRNKLTTAVCRMTVVAVGVVCLVAALVAYPLIRVLYGEAFVPAVVPFIALLPGIFAMSIQQVLGADISGRGFPGRVTIAAASGLIVNVALNLWWIPLWGTLGAALASTLSYTLIAGLVLLFFLRLSRASLAGTLVLKVQDVREVWARLRALRGASA